MTNKNINEITFGNPLVKTVVKPNTRKCGVAKVEDFFVTTDSVVAKATIVTDKKTSFLEVDWGDGEKSNINIRYAKFHKIPAFDGTNSLLPGTYELYHKYAVTPADLPSTGPAPKEYIVTLRSIDFNGDFDFRLKNITIKPKYRINFYGLSVGLKNQCDGGGLNEFTVIQTVGEDVKNEWDWHPSDDFIFAIPTYRLEGSQQSQVFEVSNTSNSTIELIHFSFTEHDKWYDDKGSLSYSTILRSYLNDTEENTSGRLEGTISLYDSNPLWQASCDLSYAVDWEIRLLVPFPSNNQIMFNAS